MDLLIRGILIGLAGWRVAHLLVNEDGPALIFERLREWAGLKPGQVSGFFPTLFTCVYCMSVWTSTFMFALWFLSPEAVMLVASWAIALVVHRIAGEQ